MPVLSIIVVNWNTRELLAGCLQSVERSQSRDSVTAEVWVVDNASTDGSVGMIRQQFPSVRLIENDQNRGFARANNQAIKASQGDYVLLLNSDTELLPGALEALLAVFEQNSRAGGAGAGLLNADGSPQRSCQPMLTPEREFWHLAFLDRLSRRATYDVGSWDMERPHEVEVLKGACLMLRREALDEVGLLDESYFMYTEEVDLSYRLAEAGWELWWVPQARVIHYGEASSRQVAEEMYIQLYRSKVQFYRKFGGEERVRRFKRLMQVAYWPRFLAATLASPFSETRSRDAGTYRRLLAELPSM